MNALSLFGMGESAPCPVECDKESRDRVEYKRRDLPHATRLGTAIVFGICGLSLISLGGRSGGWIPREMRRLSLKEM